MSDSNNTTSEDKPGKMVLRRGATEQGRVRQSFSHGRSKTVVVEKKRGKRGAGGAAAPGGGAASGVGDKLTLETRRPAREAEQSRRSRPPKGGKMLKTLSPEEATRRAKALDMARKANEERRKREAEAEALKRAEEEKAAAAAAEALRLAEEQAAQAAAEEEAAIKAEKAAQEQALLEQSRAEREAAEKVAREAEEKVEAARAARRARDAELDAERHSRQEAVAATSRKFTEEGPRIGDEVDVSALTPKLPGPKIIKRAETPPPAPKKEEQAETGAASANAGGPAARSRPKPTSADAAPATPWRKPSTREDQERKPTRAKAGDAKRRSGKLTINQALRGDEGGRQRSLASMRRRQEREKRKQANAGPAIKVVRDVKIPDVITVQELANRMAERGVDVIKALMKMGSMVTINQTIDADTAQLVVEEFGHRFARVSDADVEEGLSGDADNDADMTSRAPVVTIMGHVDHGKTSLLDALRNANVVAGEAGGITQHIGAYQVEMEQGKITFLDTPGHAAFTSMRARGAQVTDVVILVVAADDSVMPQTIEAIAHAKAAEVPMIIAINKMDRPAADAQRVRTELLQHDVQVEAMGGEVLDVEVSAVKKQGLDTLLENILLQAELLDLKANPDRPGEGVVVEAKLDIGRGPVATVLVSRGTLRVGDVFVVGEQWGKVRALVDDHNQRVDEAGPSVPVEVLGLNGTPEAGDTLVVVEDEAKAREVADYRKRIAREKSAALGSRSGASLDQLLAQAKEEENVKYLPVVVKADVQGSAEAIIQALEKVGNDEVKVRVLHSGVGAITESDVTLAEASGAPIIGFNVRANAPARKSANQKGVEIRYYSVIYDLVDDIRQAASGLLSPEVKEKFIGYAEILQVFKVSGVGNVAGCRITEGVARRSAGVRLLRDNVVIHEGTLKTLKRFKDEVREVQGGQECGMAFERYEDIREGDVIEIFEREEIERTL